MFTAYMIDDERDNCVAGRAVTDYQYQAEQHIIDAMKSGRCVLMGVILEDGEPCEAVTKEGRIPLSGLSADDKLDLRYADFFARIIPQIQASKGKWKKAPDL